MQAHEGRPTSTYNITKTQQETPVGDCLFLSLPHSFPLGENLGHLDFQPAISAAQRAMCSSVSNHHHLHFRRTAGPAQAKMSWALGALGIWLVAPLNPWSQDLPKSILPVVCQVHRELLGCDHGIGEKWRFLSAKARQGPTMSKHVLNTFSGFRRRISITTISTVRVCWPICSRTSPDVAEGYGTKAADSADVSWLTTLNFIISHVFFDISCLCFLVNSRYFQYFSIRIEHYLQYLTIPLA